MAPTLKPAPETPATTPPAAPPAEKIDVKSPSLTGGPAVMYHVGLTEDAPYDAITVPTVVLQGNIRGTCPSVSKRTATTMMDGKGNLVHQEGARIGNFVKLHPVEFAGFVKYCETHVFRKTGTYEVPRLPDDPRRQVDGKTVDTYWRAEIENVDPLPSAIRTLGEETSIQDERLTKYVWISPAIVSRDGKPVSNGAMPTIDEMRAAGTWKV